jgi:hypothetical protein
MAAFEKKYNPNRSADWNFGGPKWKLSRSKIDLFLECPRCFYLDNKLGTARPRGPAFTLNVAVDALFKKEFDAYRKKKAPHPLMTQYGVVAIPFAHKDLEAWRDNFTGIIHFHEPTGLTVSGAVDDIWEAADGSLIVVDYKATSKEGTIESLADSAWEDQYRRQIGVYSWLLEQQGFSVAKTGYFVYANARTDAPAFSNTLQFETTLIPCEGDRSWIEPTLHAIRTCLDADTYPASSPGCEYCLYREASGKKLQAIHAQKKK